MTGSQSEVRKRAAGESSPGSIVKRVWIKASTEVVFSALTESKELTVWFCDKAACDPREGGEFLAYWRSESRQGRAVITRIAPGQALDFLWVDEGVGEKQSRHTLSYEIRSRSGMTELVMTDTDSGGRDEESHAFLVQAWNTVLQELKEHCERKERSSKPKQRIKPQPRNSE